MRLSCARGGFDPVSPRPGGGRSPRQTSLHQSPSHCCARARWRGHARGRSHGDVLHSIQGVDRKASVPVRWVQELQVTQMKSSALVYIPPSSALRVGNQHV